jgi:hypothetical protein
MSRLIWRMPNAWYTPQLYSPNKLSNQAEIGQALRAMANKLEKTHLEYKADPTSLSIWSAPSLTTRLLELDQKGIQIDIYA